MKKISKKTIKRIKAGYYDDLMESIEFLIDSYNEDKFDAGYRSCIEDMSAISYSLAETIHLSFNTGRGKIHLAATVDELFHTIEEYFTNALKEQK